VATVVPAGGAGASTSVHTIASTVPANGDLNPYGITTVTQTTGALVQGDTLISNFNAASNLQGTGTTIMEIGPGSQVHQFAQIKPSSLPGPCPGGVGLTTALDVLPGGYVVVGSLPVTHAGTGSPKAGCLIVLNSTGVPVETFSGHGINGPWDMTEVQNGSVTDLFVSSVLNGLNGAPPDTPVDMGTVLRLAVTTSDSAIPALTSVTTVGSGFAEELDPAALVIGPTGVALGPSGTLFVADTVNSRIAAIPSALTRGNPVTGGGSTVSTGGSLNGPLGLIFASNGDLLAVNSGDGNGVELTTGGTQVATILMDPTDSAGALFGLVLAPDGHDVLFVDDADNTLKELLT
jgi:hypothetical protein